MSTKKPVSETKAKPNRIKKFALYGTACLLLLGGGVGAGIYAKGAGITGARAVSEDPSRPKLVVRNTEEDVHSAEEEGAEGKEAAPKIGTVAVKNDRVRIDPKRFEVTYFPIEGSFTANLADGSGFVQVGVSLATYFDHRLIANLQRQSVPIRSAILLVLSNQEAAVLSTPQGKQMLQRELTNAINLVLRNHEGFGGVDNVYFTNLVIQ
jgi:flagellar protein FliL